MVEEGKTENFRSALELLKMIDGALDGRDIKEDAEEDNQERAVWRTKNFEELKRSQLIDIIYHHT